MVNRESEDVDRLLTLAVNAHGIPFKKRVRATLEGLVLFKYFGGGSYTPVRIVAEEHPVAYLDGMAIDLLAEVWLHGPLSSMHYLIPIECKRAYVANKRWLFVKDSDSDCRFLYWFQGIDLRDVKFRQLEHFYMPKRNDEAPKRPVLCSDGIEIDSAKLKSKDVYKAASPDPIYNAANQICKGALGFISDELDRRNDEPSREVDCYLFPMLITTASLLLCDPEPSQIDPSSGTYQGDLVTQQVPWLVLRHPFATLRSAPDSRRHAFGTAPSPKEAGEQLKEAIVVLNANYIKDFFGALAGAEIG